MTARGAPAATHVTAGASLPNTVGREQQDRYSCGQDERGAWLIVADGVSLGDHGALAAMTAVNTAVSTLLGGTFTRDTVQVAVHRAHDFVRKVLGADGRGGTTLSVAVLVGSTLHVAAVGDSPVYIACRGVLDQLTPELYGPLRQWVGQPAPLCPWVQSRRVPLGACVLVCSDGATPVVGPAVGSDPQRWVVHALARRRTSDDATIVAAVATRSETAPAANGLPRTSAPHHVRLSAVRRRVSRR